MQGRDPRVLVESSIYPVKHFWLLLSLIAVFGFLVRAYDISNRPFHNDEGVNFFFIEQTDHHGYYPYSHKNYHGPTYFYLTKAFLDASELVQSKLEDLQVSESVKSFFGVNDLWMRFSAIFCGVLLLFLLLSRRKDEGDIYVLITSALVAVSASSVFYARYAIHETLFLLSSAALGFCLYDWAVHKSKRAVYLGGASLAVLIGTKETFIISIFCLGLAYLSLGNIKERFLAFWDDRRVIMGALVLCVVLTILFFTGGFKWFDGVREMFLAVPQWVGRNESDHGHHKEFLYYTKIFLETEPQVLLALIFPILFLIVDDVKFLRELKTREGLWIRFTTVWGLSAWLVYSFVKYKTPWLIINITFPLTLASGWWLALMFRKASKYRLVAWVTSVAVSLSALWLTYFFVFKKPYGPGNPFSYVHSSTSFYELLKVIEDYREENPDARILFGQVGYWPFPYYVRDYADKVAYVRSDNPAAHIDEYDVILVDHTVKWDHPDFAKRYFRQSDVGEVFVYLRRKK